MDFPIPGHPVWEMQLEIHFDNRTGTGSKKHSGRTYFFKWVPSHSGRHTTASEMRWISMENEMNGFETGSVFVRKANYRAETDPCRDRCDSKCRLTL